MNTNIATETQTQPRAEMLRDWIKRFTPAPGESQEAAILLSIKAAEVSKKLDTPTLTAQDLRELSPEHAARLAQWIVAEGFAGAQREIKFNWGLIIHRPTLQRYYAASLNQQQVENVQELSGTADSILDAASSGFGMQQAAIVLLEKRIFELLLHERASAKELSRYTDILCKLRRSNL